MYKLNPETELQRGFRIPKETSVEQYIRDRRYYPDMLTSDRVMVATIGQECYGFNVLSAIILEALLAGQEESETVKRIGSLFAHSSEQLAQDYRKTVETLLDNKIILKEENNHVI